MRCTDPASKPNQLALRLCTIGPTECSHAHKSPGKPHFGQIWATFGNLALGKMYLGCVTALLTYGDPCVTVTEPYISPCAYSTVC
jgi:hypothetical protein